MAGTTCPICEGTILTPSIGGARRGSCHCIGNLRSENPMTPKTMKTKRNHGTAENPNPVSYTLPEPATEAHAAEVTPKTPKPISYAPSGEPIRAVKAGTKLALLIDLLARPEGATLEELATELSRTGSAVNLAAARSWLSYDLRRTGLGVVQPDDHLHLVGTPLPHRESMPTKPAAPAIQNVEAAPLRKAAMTAGRPKKAGRAKR